MTQVPALGVGLPRHSEGHRPPPHNETLNSRAHHLDTALFLRGRGELPRPLPASKNKQTKKLNWTCSEGKLGLLSELVSSWERQGTLGQQPGQDGEPGAPH